MFLFGALWFGLSKVLWAPMPLLSFGTMVAGLVLVPLEYLVGFVVWLLFARIDVFKGL